MGVQGRPPPPPAGPVIPVGAPAAAAAPRPPGLTARVSSAAPSLQGPDWVTGALLSRPGAGHEAEMIVPHFTVLVPSLKGGLRSIPCGDAEDLLGSRWVIPCVPQWPSGQALGPAGPALQIGLLQEEGQVCAGRWHESRPTPGRSRLSAPPTGRRWGRGRYAEEKFLLYRAPTVCQAPCEISDQDSTFLTKAQEIWFLKNIFTYHLDVTYSFYAEESTPLVSFPTTSSCGGQKGGSRWGGKAKV